MQTIRSYDDGTALADPFHVFRPDIYDEFLAAIEKVPKTVGEWIPIQFRGVDLQLYRTGADGMYFGVPIDTGLIVKFALKDLPTMHPPKSNEAQDAANWKYLNTGRNQDDEALESYEKLCEAADKYAELHGIPEITLEKALDVFFDALKPPERKWR